MKLHHYRSFKKLFWCLFNSYAPLFISHVFSTAVAGQGKVVSIGCIGAYRFQF